MLGPTVVATVAALLAESFYRTRLECLSDARHRPQASGYSLVAPVAVGSVPPAGLSRSLASAPQRLSAGRGRASRPLPPRPCCPPPLPLPPLCFPANRSPPSDASSLPDFRLR